MGYGAAPTPAGRHGQTSVPAVDDRRVNALGQVAYPPLDSGELSTVRSNPSGAGVHEGLRSESVVALRLVVTRDRPDIANRMPGLRYSR
ncbi:hypothetical protein A5780_14775 [Nocardia sp. 852002-20019_SCH5090214]|uniref:Uncharacterized protein n=1 Tax=Nocardia nova TaxID=37330 RepID=A0A2S6A2K5_9NOCA|nr:hypothetical protein A5780_14775 [Nocardia sp. 852002-20019_SCH5090214]PPJ25936.1 hypothetical protein C5F51_21815 [Nocardia nova]